MSTVNVDIKTLMQKAKAHNAEQLAAAKAQLEERKQKQMIEQLARNLEHAGINGTIVQQVVAELRQQRKMCKLYEEKLQSVANAATKFEEDADIIAFNKAVDKANETWRKKYYKI